MILMQATYDRIAAQHFKTAHHIIPGVDRGRLLRPWAKARVKKFIANKLPHDVRVSERRLRPYMVKIFSNTLNTWFHDIYDNTSIGEPRYWHIFIGTNTRFVIAHPLKSRSSADVHESLLTFLRRVRPRKLTSDKETSFSSTENLRLLREYNCAHQFINSGVNHSPLAIIDRFIRTLRDMNTPTASSNQQSTDDAFKWLSRTTMSSLLNEYNNAPHSAIGCSPTEMYRSQDLEKEYIWKCLEQQSRQHRIGDFKLKIGDYVKYRLPRTAPFGSKKRTQYSPEQYMVKDVRGAMYEISGSDGSTMLLPRWRLIRVS